MTNYHTDLPSLHEVMTDMWTPSTLESTAGLEAQDFCTTVSLIKAMVALNNNNDDWDEVESAYYWEQVADGSLGFAYKSILTALGLQVNDTNYDYTCENVDAWPESNTNSDEPLFLTADPDEPIACIFTTERTEYLV
jgi:hypothetical protein